MTNKPHIVCTGCGAVNAAAPDRDALKAKCGKCAAPLFSGHPAAVDSAGFARQTTQGDIPVLVDVWAPWCGPCRQMTPLFERAAQELEPQVRLIKLNADEAPEVCQRFGIRGIPTLLLLGRNRLLAQTAGVMDTARIIEWTRSHLPKLKETT
jgi:thioredoxin 2